MRRHRWPALAPPTTGGIVVHTGMPIAAEKDLALELSAATAFASGLALRFTLCVTGVRGDFARYETRPLTDPGDWSAQWSYLVVHIGADAPQAVTATASGADRKMSSTSSTPAVSSTNSTAAYCEPASSCRYPGTTVMRSRCSGR
ncbi:hypothetical protein ACFTZB_36135 [Rhodococcus sp. NPDC057014]|uniref:hypothetical protein n=1 Tax=Rhodococcus sp. NPDC057014 TaxID=3346000 RepID=UPI00362D8606